MNQPAQRQEPPGQSREMRPQPDHGEQLPGLRTAVRQGRGHHRADSGIGRAVAIAFAREGANVLISYLDEHDARRADNRA
jgi:hypothetical protein